MTPAYRAKSALTALILPSLILAASLSACMGGPAEGVAPAPLTPTQRFTLQVEPGQERIALAVREDGLSDNQQSALIDMANRFSIEGAPVLRIEAPSGNDPVANGLAWDIKHRLEAFGLPAPVIQVVGYDAPDPRAPILVGYDTVRAVVPQCGTNWTNLTRSAANAGSANFGCAVTANLAAQIENPRDIVTPRNMPAADTARRTVVFDKYRKGQAASAAREELLTTAGRVSQAVQ